MLSARVLRTGIRTPEASRKIVSGLPGSPFWAGLVALDLLADRQQ
jgi:hypothetical protein